MVRKLHRVRRLSYDCRPSDESVAGLLRVAVVLLIRELFGWARSVSREIEKIERRSVRD